jgi:predicted enzyme related to lactoylglutathione lyase
MLQPTGIAFALYLVTDVARARKFYEQTLGLKVCAEMEFAPGQWWIEYDVGGPSALAITNFKSPGSNHAPSPGIALEVTNRDEALAALRTAGVAITWGPHDFPVCHSFGFKDPDGNDLFVHQRKSAA